MKEKQKKIITFFFFKKKTKRKGKTVVTKKKRSTLTKHMRALVLVCLCLSIACIVTCGVANVRSKNARVKSKISILTTWLLCLLGWPLIWGKIMGKETHRKEALVSLFWPILIIAIDVVGINNNSYESVVSSKHQVLHMDANMICSLTFALSAVIGAQKHECCSKIFLYAVMGCIAFVLPAPHMHSSSSGTLVFEALQKAILAFATGLLLTGVLMVVRDKESLGKNGLGEKLSEDAKEYAGPIRASHRGLLSGEG